MPCCAMPCALLHICQQFGENCCLHILLWNLRQLVSSKHLSASSRWHDAICSKMVILTITSVGTSDLMDECLFCKMSTICHVYCQNLKLPLCPACWADLCMWPVCAWKYERQDIAIPCSQHTEDGLEDTIQPAVLAVSEQEIQFWEFFNRCQSWL